MNETEFHQLVDSQLERIEAAIDEAGADIDYETSGNDGSQIIINRQEPMREIWLASKSGGYHFKSIDGEWICSKTGLELLTLLKQECDKHADEPIDWV